MGEGNDRNTMTIKRKSYMRPPSVSEGPHRRIHHAAWRAVVQFCKLPSRERAERYSIARTLVAIVDVQLCTQRLIQMDGGEADLGVNIGNLGNNITGEGPYLQHLRESSKPGPCEQLRCQHTYREHQCP